MKQICLLTFLAAAILPYGVRAGCISPNADTYIKEGVGFMGMMGDSDANFGMSSDLAGQANVDMSMPPMATVTGAEKIYIRFDLVNDGGLMQSEVADITGFQLTLTLAANVMDTSTFDVYALTDGGTESWAESTITWNNAPENDTGSAIAMSGATDLGVDLIVNSSSAGTLYTINIPDSVFDSDSNGLVTFVIVPQSYPTSEVVFHSKESGSGADAPVGSSSSFPGTPEPGSLTLFGLGFALLLGHRGLGYLRGSPEVGKTG